MAGYRVYFLDSRGRIERAKELQCSNDAEAIAALEAEGCYAELWQRDRFIKSNNVLIGPTPALALPGSGQARFDDGER